MLKLGGCGDDCNYCPRYLATQSGDKERFQEVAAMWQIAGWRDKAEPAEKLACQGCASVKSCGLGIKECLAEKGIDSCGKCAKYPCGRLLRIINNNEKEAEICRSKLSPEDYDLFRRAFFTKQGRLERIRQNYLI